MEFSERCLEAKIWWDHGSSKKSRILEFFKKVRNTIIICIKKIMFPGHLLFIFLQSIWKKYHGVFTLQFSLSTFEQRSSSCLLFCFTLFLYENIHHRLKACVWWEFTQKTLCFCCFIKKFRGLTKYMVPHSIKHKTSKNQLTKKKQANI